MTMPYSFKQEITKLWTTVFFVKLLKGKFRA